MKKLLLTLALLLFASTVWANPWAMMAMMGGVESGAGSAPDVFDETFENSEFDEATWGAETVTNSSTISGDDTTRAVSGTKSMLINGDTAADDCRINATFTEQTGAAYFRVKFYVTAADWGTAWQWVHLVIIYDGAYSFIDIELRYKSTTEMDILLSGRSATSGNLVGVTDTWNEVLFYYPNDGVNNLEYKLNGGTAVEIADTETADPDNFTFGESGAISSSHKIWVEDVGVSTTAAGVGW